MDDEQIIELFWQRSQLALAETSAKYERYCHAISLGILGDERDAQECVNDALRRAWEAIPPNRPQCLKTYMGKIVRNLSLNRLKGRKAQKRGLGQAEVALAELEECLCAPGLPEQALEDAMAAQIVNRFLGRLPEAKRRVFVRRYWYFSSIQDIAKQYRMSESKVKSMLARMRKQLQADLQKEDITL